MMCIRYHATSWPAAVYLPLPRHLNMNVHAACWTIIYTQFSHILVGIEHELQHTAAPLRSAECLTVPDPAPFSLPKPA